MALQPCQAITHKFNNNMEKKKLTKSERAVERFAEMMISTI